MSHWFVEPSSVSGVLTAEQAALETLASQISGTRASGEGGAGQLWNDRLERLGTGLGPDGIVGQAVGRFLEEHVGASGAALNRFGAVVMALRDAAVALLNGDEAMAAQVVTDAKAAIGPDAVVGGV